MEALSSAAYPRQKSNPKTKMSITFAKLTFNYLDNQLFIFWNSVDVLKQCLTKNQQDLPKTLLLKK